MGVGRVGWRPRPHCFKWNGPTQYLTRQRLPMACVKLFLAVFVVPILQWRRQDLLRGGTSGATQQLLFCVCYRH